MKRSLLIIAAAAVALLAGCSDMEIKYKGEIMPATEAEERIADELEVENPDLDLEIDIYTESDD